MKRSWQKEKSEQISAHFFKKTILMHRVISLAENSKIPLSTSIAFVQTNPEWAKPQPLLQAERAHTQDEKYCMYALFC